MSVLAAAPAGPGNTYRYLTTHLVTGQVLSDTIPLNVQSFSVQLNGTGQLTGSLDLEENYPANQPYIEALEPRRSVLWVLQNDYPVWCGVIWDWPDMTRAQGTLPVTAQTIDSVWAHRLITDTIQYQGTDLFAVFLDLVNYGMTKQSGHISAVSPAAARQPGYLAYMASSGGVAGLQIPAGVTSGVPWTVGYTYSDLAQVSDAWSAMVSAGNFEYVFEPGLDSDGNLAIFIRLGYTRLGRALGQSGYSLTYPGNVLDYGYQRTGSQGANVIWGTAPPNGSAVQWGSIWPHGADLGDLAAGYPVMEATVSWNGSVVTAQSQVDGFADGEVTRYTQAMTAPVISIGGGGFPRLTDIVLGDSCWFSATSPLHPPQGAGSQPGLQQQVRITGLTCYPPGPSQPEYYQLTTSVVTS